MAFKTKLQEPPRWAALPIVACGGAAAVAAGQFVGAAAAEAIGSALIALVAVALIFWKARSEGWLYSFLVVAGTAHLLLWLLLPWPVAHRPARGDSFFVLTDFFVTAGSAMIVRHLICRRREHRNDA
jgi:hypothetical protein